MATAREWMAKYVRAEKALSRLQPERDRLADDLSALLGPMAVACAGWRDALAELRELRRENRELRDTLARHGLPADGDQPVPDPEGDGYVPPPF